jgi:hypothetical protein
MTEFIIMEDFPKSEIEFDQRFLDKSACYDYLFKMKWPYGLGADTLISMRAGNYFKKL